MELHPARPPGRANRKALTCATEIQRLHVAGHSLEAIRLALQAAGIAVGRSTVHREVTRLSSGTRPSPDPWPAQPVLPLATASDEPARPVSSSLAQDARSGRAIAEAFMKGRITNPLMQVRNPR